VTISFYLFRVLDCIWVTRLCWVWSSSSPKSIIFHLVDFGL